MDVVMTPQHKQKGRSLYGPALFARSPVPEMDPVVSDDRTVKSFSNGPYRKKYEESVREINMLHELIKQNLMRR
jgi:hypothetical protein